jgi:hypothetical protein
LSASFGLITPAQILWEIDGYGSIKATIRKNYFFAKIPRPGFRLLGLLALIALQFFAGRQSQAVTCGHVGH